MARHGIRIFQGLKYNDEKRCTAKRNHSWIWTPEDGLNKGELDLYIPEKIVNSQLNGSNKLQSGPNGLRSDQTKAHSLQGGPNNLMCDPHSREYCDTKEQMYDRNSNSTEKNCNGSSDMFSKASKAPPLVVFIHGGGWRRGHHASWKYFISKYDTNIFMALVHQFIFRFYANFGNTLAQNGIPCAVISYPISRLQFPWTIAEMITSFLTNYLMFGVLSIVGLILFAILGYHPVLDLQDYLLETTWTNLDPLLTVLALHGGITQLFIWTVIVFNARNYNLTKKAAVVLLVCLIWISYMTSQFIVTSQLVMTSQQLVIISLMLIMTSQLSLLYIQTCIPIVQHPEPVKSVAKCISWLHKSSSFRGLYDPETIVLLGHSAGGHLATLLALDNKYLKEAGCNPSIIKGIISISGVYSVPRIATSWMAKKFIIIPAFGTDQSEWEKSSPLNHVKQYTIENSTVPKFLLFCAENEFPFLQRDARDLSDRFNEFDVAHEYFIIKGTNHFTIASNFGRHSAYYNKHLTKRCLNFIEEVSEKS